MKKVIKKTIVKKVIKKTVNQSVKTMIYELSQKEMACLHLLLGPMNFDDTVKYIKQSDDYANVKKVYKLTDGQIDDILYNIFTGYED